MYKLPPYHEPDDEVIFSFIKENSFALITGISEDYPVATQIPLEVIIDESGKVSFTGHMMKGTDHYKAFSKNNNVLVLFTGPHCYVSASWYANPRGGSTWNYLSVHAKGKLTFMDDEGTFQMVKSITEKYEAESENPSLIEQMPEDYVRKNIKAISGFRIVVEDLKHVFKLSQDKSSEDQLSIITRLKVRGDFNSTQIATEMEKRIIKIKA